MKSKYSFWFNFSGNPDAGIGDVVAGSDNTTPETDIAFFQGAVKTVKFNPPIVNWSFPPWVECITPGVDSFPTLDLSQCPPDVTSPNITSINLTPGVDFIIATCTAVDNVGILNFDIGINDSTISNVTGINPCSHVFVDLNPNTDYNITFTARDLSSNTASNSSVTTTLKEAQRDWTPQGNMLMRWIYDVKETWRLFVKKIFITSDDELTSAKLWINDTNLQIDLNNTGNITVNTNIITVGCFQFNCSQAGGCVTLGVCT